VLRLVAGHEARVHEGVAFRKQWRPDRVYVVELADEEQIFSIGTGYANRQRWVYKVEPVGDSEPDPEVSALYLSRLYRRARVIKCLHDPTSVG
jgi:hypothetical protein